MSVKVWKLIEERTLEADNLIIYIRRKRFFDIVIKKLINFNNTYVTDFAIVIFRQNLLKTFLQELSF